MTGDDMNKVNRIRIYFLYAAIFIVGIFQVIKFYEPIEKEPIVSQTSEKTVRKNVEHQKETVPAVKKEEYKYIILEEEDYLTVYFKDRETVYEYTDIQYSSLPDNLRQKIRNGYCLRNDAELFGFLENYSS